MITERFETLPVGVLRESARNTRRTFNAAKLAELVASIREKGIISPLIARPHPAEEGAYEIAAGHRRYRGAVAAGVEALPVIIRDYDDAQFVEVLTIENLQREDVHPMEEAAGYADLLKTPGWTVATLAAKLGKDPSYIHRRLKLLDLTDTARQIFVNGGMTLSHALIIARIPAVAQMELIDTRALFDRDGGAISLHALEAWIERNVQLALANAPFSLADAKLLDGAGSCVDCTKRMGAAPALWPEIQDGDRCLDRACYGKKCQAAAHQKLVKLQKEAKKLNGVEPLRISGAWHSEMEGVLTKRKWIPEEGKTCEHLQPAVVVETGNGFQAQVGDSFRVCATRTCTIHWGGLYTPPAKEPKQGSKSLAEAKLANLLKRIADEKEGVLEDRRVEVAALAVTWPLDLGVLRELLATYEHWRLKQIASQMGYTSSEETPAVGRLVAAISAMEPKDLAGLLFRLLLDQSDDQERVLTSMINPASAEELVAAVAEEIDAKFADELAAARAAVEKAEAAAKKGKGK